MSSLSDFYKYGKVKIHFPNKVDRNIRLADLVSGIIDDYGAGAHGGIASYTYVSNLGDAIVDPGIGNCGVTTAADDFWGEQLVISTTDKNGLDMLGTITWVFYLFGALEVYDVFIYLRSKKDPKRYLGLYVYDLDAITDDEGAAVGFVFNVLPLMMSTTYDAGTDEYALVEIPNNDEVVMSWDFAFNPEYIGSMGTQDRDEVSITGGWIVGTNLDETNTYRVDTDTPTVEPGWASCSTIDMNAPDGYLKFKVGDQDVVVPYWNT